MKQDYSRIQDAVDTKLLKNTHIIGVGAGGAYSLYESLCRSGVGKLSIIDFDHVEETNLVRQGYCSDDIGKLKVEALKEHLSKINTDTVVEVIALPVQDISKAVDEDELFQSADLMLFLTDSFEAQSYGNLLALKYQKPALWAGFYERSRCAEIVFYIPKITPACFRCAVSPRYEAQKHQVINISSHSNMIFHSQMLDSVIGMICMAMLHNKTKGYEFSNWFGDYWDRSLFQIKTHPQYSEEEGSLFERVFKGTGGRTFLYNSIWQTIEREEPPKYELCPDCGKIN